MRLDKPAARINGLAHEHIEGAVGFYLQRNFVVRASVQGNWREAGRDRSRTYLSGQLVYWF